MAPARGCRLPLATVGILIALGLNLALYLRRGGGGGLAIVGLSHLNLLLMFLSLRRFERSPPRSTPWVRARLAVWLLVAMLTAAFTWKAVFGAALASSRSGIVATLLCYYDRNVRVSQRWLLRLLSD